MRSLLEALTGYLGRGAVGHYSAVRDGAPNVVWERGECLTLIELSIKGPAGGRQAGMLTNIKRVGTGNPYSYSVKCKGLTVGARQGGLPPGESHVSY
jgi:hypothetical protein